MTTKINFNQINGIAANALDYGASPSTTAAVNTAAMQDAIDSGADTVYIPAGDYAVEPVTTRSEALLGATTRAAILMENDNQTLVMDAGTILRSQTWAGAGSANDDSGSTIQVLGADNVRISGGIIIGNWVTGGSYPSRNVSAANGINVSSTSNVTLENVTCNAVWGNGIAVSYYAANTLCKNPTNTNIINCHADKNYRVGLAIVGAQGGAVIGGSYTGTIGEDPWAGIDLEPNNVAVLNGGAGASEVVNMQFIGVRTSGNYTGVKCIGGPTGNTTINAVQNNQFVGCDIEDGMLLQGADTAADTCNYNTIVGCTIKKNNAAESGIIRSGLKLSGSQYNTITGNSIYDCKADGIELNYNSNTNEICGNSIQTVSQETDDTYMGIRVAGSYNNIQGNRVSKGAGANAAAYGIYIKAVSGTPTANSVVGNSVHSAGVSGDFNDVDGSDTVYLGYGETQGQLKLGASTDLKWGKTTLALGGGAAATLGTIGGSGPATAGQFGWERFINSAGDSSWFPVWK